MRFSFLLITLTVSVIFFLCGAQASQSRGILRAGRRQLSSLPETFTTAQLSYLVSSEIGHGTKAVQDDILKKNSELLKLTSTIFEKPRLIVLGFLPSNGQSLPSGIFDDSVSPFNIEDSSRNCANNDLNCLRDSILEFPLDDQSELVMIDQGVEFVQWAGEPTKNVDLAKEMIDAIKASFDAETPDIQSQLKSLSQIPSLPQISINTETQTFTIGQEDSQSATFQLNDACTRALIAEASGLQTVHSHIPNLTAPESGAQVIILSPTRALRCFTETKAPSIQISAAQHLLLKLIEQIITSAEEAADGKVFALIATVEDNENAQSSLLNRNEITDGVSIIDKQEFDKSADNEPSSVSMIEVAARRRLQATKADKKTMQAPRMTVLWLCIVLVFVLVFAIVPLFGLSSINDPIISTKLFTPSHHS